MNFYDSYSSYKVVNQYGKCKRINLQNTQKKGNCNFVNIHLHDFIIANSKTKLNENLVIMTENKKRLSFSFKNIFDFEGILSIRKENFTDVCVVIKT